MADLPTIEHDGMTIKPKRFRGRMIYRCPYGCGEPSYPKPKWLTEAGFRKHLENCYAREWVAGEAKPEGDPDYIRDENAVAVPAISAKSGDGEFDPFDD